MLYKNPLNVYSSYGTAYQKTTRSFSERRDIQGSKSSPSFSSRRTVEKSSFELKAGDVILSRRDTWLSKSIRWFGKVKTGKAEYSHAAMALGELSLTGDQVIESLWKVEMNDFSKYRNQDIVIWRHNLLTEKQRQNIAIRAVTLHSDGYAFFKIPLFALDSVFRTYWWTRTFGFSNFKVCSNLIAWSYEKEIGNTVFGAQGWRSTDPVGLNQWCEKNKKVWTPVLKTRSDSTDKDRT